MKPAMAVAVLAVAGLIGAGCASNLTGDGDDPPRPAPSSETVAGGPAVPTVLVIDGSGSMLEDDAPGPRIDAAKAAAHTLIDGLDTGTELAVVTYGTETTTDEADHGASCRDVTTVLPAGPLDAGAARDAVDSISPSGFTPIAASLTHAADQLPETGAQAIVLISDGEDTCDTPPCEVAADLHDQRPELTISTIGFRTEGEGQADLRCIAETTGGLFVTADNADQLAERLLATRDLDTARTALTSTGIADIAIGDSAEQIRKRHPDLPEVAGSGTVTIVWIDCDLVFEDGLLTEIAPHDGGRTIDGVGPGEKFSAATRLYGEPVQTEALGGGAVAQTVVADGTARTGYRIDVESDAPDARITQVVLCKCLPGTGDKAGSGDDSGRVLLRSEGSTEIFAVWPVDADGAPLPGWRIVDDRAQGSGMTVEDCYVNPGGAYQCGTSADYLPNCIQDGTATGGGYSLLCLRDPLGDELIPIRASKLRSVHEGVPLPAAIVLDNGDVCELRIGGSWSNPKYDPDEAGTFSCGDKPATWTIGGERFLIDRDGWWVNYGAFDEPLQRVRVAQVYYVEPA